MYPNLYYFFHEVFGVEIPMLKIVNTFGFFVAIAFIVAAYVLYKELRRKEQLGIIAPTTRMVRVGEPATIWELIPQFIIGFILGFKFIGIFAYGANPYFDAQRYLLSAQGSLWGGILVGLILAGVRWWDKHKQKRAKPVTEKVLVHPYERVGDFTMICFIGGFIGAKIFHNLENWRTFIANPIGELFSLGGLTYYGGLIVAAALVVWYARANKIGGWVIADCFAPVMMIAYAVGRLGCQFSGDGDWGILNSAYISNIDGDLVRAVAGQFDQALINNTDYYTRAFGSIDNVPHAYFDPSWLPKFLVASNYPNNVLGEGFPLEGCEGPYCAFLPVGVFPTPIYEVIVCAILFVIIWRARKRTQVPGYMAALYLFLAGIERFLVELIRVNTQYHIGGLAFTQAELISVLCVLSAVLIVYYQKRVYRGVLPVSKADMSKK